MGSNHTSENDKDDETQKNYFAKLSQQLVDKKAREQKITQNAQKQQREEEEDPDPEDQFLNTIKETEREIQNSRIHDIFEDPKNPDLTNSEVFKNQKPPRNLALAQGMEGSLEGNKNLLQKLLQTSGNDTNKNNQDKINKLE